MAEEEGAPDTPGDRAWRRRFTKKTGDKRDDYALDLFREAEAHLTDTPRVARLLLELGRYYNPLSDGPIVDLDSRRRVLEAVTRGDLDEARAVLKQLIERYMGPEDPPEPSPR